MDRVPVGSIEHSGITTEVALEEGRNFRRIAIVRSKFTFGEVREVGRVHIYMDELPEYISLLQLAHSIGVQVGEGKYAFKDRTNS